MKTLLALLLSATIANAQTCPQRLQLRPVPATSRGGTIIWKSNWNKEMQRENTIEEGNHSQKGAALEGLMTAHIGRYQTAYVMQLWREGRE